MEQMNIPIHRGTIIAIEQMDGKVKAVRLDTGEHIEVETLLWTPPEKQTLLVKKLVDKFDLPLNEMGHLKTDENQETKVKGLFAAGDVQGWSGALEAAKAGSKAASMIVYDWNR